MFAYYLVLTLVAVRLAWPVLWKRLLDMSTEKETAMYDAERFTELDLALKQGSSDKGSPKKRSGTCVIAGGGVAGCMMAAVATRHYERVVIVEPCQSNDSWRNFIKQYDQLHNFSPFTVEGLQRIWPGLFREEVLKRGGRFGRYETVRFEFWLNKARVDWDSNVDKFGPTGDDCLMMNRPGLQAVIGDLTKLHTPGVEFVYGKVTGASLGKDDDALIDRVHIKTASGEGKWLDCQLFIDCSGAARVYKNILKVLNDPRFEAPKVEEYQMNVSYSTALIDVDETIARRLPLPESLKPGWKDISNVLLTAPTLTNGSSFALMTHTDGNKCELRRRCFRFSLLTAMTDYLGCMKYNTSPDMLPKNLDHFRQHVKEAFAANTGQDIGPWLDETVDLLQENEDLTEQKAHFRQARDSDSYVTIIEAVNRKLPHNLVLVGDSFSKLNPAFGQGTHKAMSDCLTLSASLSKFDNLNDVARDFDARRNPRSYGLFDFNRAMDLASPDIQKREWPSPFFLLGQKSPLLNFHAREK